MKTSSSPRTRTTAANEAFAILAEAMRTSGEASDEKAAGERDTQDVPRCVLAETLRLAVLEELHVPEPTPALRTARLFSDARFAFPSDVGSSARLERGRHEARAVLGGNRESIGNDLGMLYEALLRRSTSAGPIRSSTPATSRKRMGSFYTPPELAREVIRLALDETLSECAPFHGSSMTELRICDPSLGGGVFLVELCKELGARLAGDTTADARALLRARREVAMRCLFGVDIDGLAVAVTELNLWLAIGDSHLSVRDIGHHLREGDALLGSTGAPSDVDSPRHGGRAPVHWSLEFPQVFARGGFDLVIGNPPWVAYAGRSAQPLPFQLRRHFRRAFEAMRGFPTLHGLFIERALDIAPRGRVALLVPSPVCDLDGYRAVRERLTRSHRVCEPLTEFGQDAFSGVTQPCAALLAGPASDAVPSSASWSLRERQRRGAQAEELDVPELLQLLGRAPRFSAETFRELGFQSTRLASTRLFLRSEAPSGPFVYPLLEGRRVREFRELPVALFLDPDPGRVRAARCRVRPLETYRTVEFVVRQTAKYPIAALHAGLPFRNTLLAGFAPPHVDATTLVGLLNSALYRALHLASRRDARQAAFPQVKIAHLRALPAPPSGSHLARVRELSLEAARAVTCELRHALDDAVFDAFSVPTDHRSAVRNLLARRAPELGYAEQPVSRSVTDLGSVMAAISRREERALG